ncbi:MAG: hypothetical protein O2913_03490 [Chloroflexi bacterium]|nr:hypothetical protein [Chloroflexota bacterium]
MVNSVTGQGLAVSKSDVSELPDSVLTFGEVLFVPQEHAVDLAEAADFDPPGIDGMRHAFFQLDQSQFAKLNGAAVVIGTDGRFPLDIPAGQYFVCLANSFVGHTSGPPYSVVGCSVIDLPKNTSLTVSFGEGGVEVTVDDAVATSNSGITGTTNIFVESGAPPGGRTGGPASVEFAIAPMEADSPVLDKAIFLTSEADGTYKVDLPPGTYWIGPKGMALNPIDYSPGPFELSVKVAVVKEGAFTQCDISEIVYAP